MTTKRHVVRFGVRAPDGRRSAVWRAWRADRRAEPGDVYVAMRDAADIFKVSIHASGDCRTAYARHLARELQISDRVQHSWRIERGAHIKARAVFNVLFPVEELAAFAQRDDETMGVEWLEPTHGAELVEVAVGLAPTSEEDRIRAAVAPGKRLLAIWPSGTDEICWVQARIDGRLSDTLLRRLREARQAVREVAENAQPGFASRPSVRLALGFLTDGGQNGALELRAG